MLKIKKMTAVLLSVVMLVCCFAVTASAESIADTAKAHTSGKTYSVSSKLYEKSDYKIVLNKAGDLKLSVTSQMNSLYVTLYDKNGNKIKASDLKADSGKSSWNSIDNLVNCLWNNAIEKYSGSFKYTLKKGTYYLRFYNNSLQGKGKFSFKATYPSSDAEETSEISCITIPMKVGEAMQLSTDAGSTGVTWSSSKSSVAAVSSSGKVTAKKAGTTVITAKSGSTTAKIQIKVTK